MKMKALPPTTILDKFAWELKYVLEQVLTERNYNPERLQMWLLVILSRDVYVKQLLYCEFGGHQASVVGKFDIVDANRPKRTVRIHEQAITYYAQVLGRRLTLAQNLLDAPTNLHRLFEFLCRCGVPTELWHDAHVGRAMSQPQPEKEAHPSFQQVDKELSAQGKKLGGISRMFLAVGERSTGLSG